MADHKKKLAFLFKDLEEVKKNKRPIYFFFLGTITVILLGATIGILGWIFTDHDPKKDKEYLAAIKVKQSIPSRPPINFTWPGIEKSLQSLNDKIEQKETENHQTKSEDEKTSLKIAIIVKSLGISPSQTRKLIQSLPQEVSLSFSPYAKDLSLWTSSAKNKGHGIWIDLPLESDNFPYTDTGPLTLLTTLTEKENNGRLKKIMNKTSHYKGLLATYGEKFSINEPVLLPILNSIKKNKLLFVDNRPIEESKISSIAQSLELSHGTVSLELDYEPSRMIIEKNMKITEKIAQYHGSAIALASPYPITYELLEKWISTFPQKNITLVPVSRIIYDEQ